MPNTIGLPRYATFETGANAGRTVGVKSWTQAIRRLELWVPTGLPVAVGDQLRIYPGCHKRVLEDCRDRSGTSSTGEHILWLSSGTTPNLRHQASGGGTVTITSSVAIVNDTTWSTIVGTWRPGRLELYVVPCLLYS